MERGAQLSLPPYTGQNGLSFPRPVDSRAGASLLLFVVASHAGGESSDLPRHVLPELAELGVLLVVLPIPADRGDEVKRFGDPERVDTPLEGGTDIGVALRRDVGHDTLRRVTSPVVARTLRREREKSMATGMPTACE